MHRIPPSIALTVALLAAAEALAGPGALEISETCAVHTGCFAGDTAGYPVTITPAAPASSFVLTSDLHLPDANTSGIEITKPMVRVDLGGFTIRGVTTCTGDPNVCTNTGTGHGVDTGGNIEGVEVSNGAITGAGATCANVNVAGTIRNVRADQCGSAGLQVAQRGVITDSLAHRASFVGISAGDGSSISGSSATFTAGDGINALGASVVNSAAYKNTGIGIQVLFGAAENCTARENGEHGFQAFGPATLRGNSALRNGDAGIYVAQSAATVVENSVVDNGDGETTDHGIHCITSGCNLQRNTARNNDGWGILANDATTGYGGNVTHNNAQGAVSGGTDLGGNLLN